MFSKYLEIGGIETSVIAFELKEDGTEWPEPIDISLRLSNDTSSKVLVSLTVADARKFAFAILDGIHHVEDDARQREIEMLHPTADDAEGEEA